MKIFKVGFYVFFIFALTATAALAGNGHEHAETDREHDHEERHAKEHGDEHGHGHEDQGIPLSEESRKLGGIMTAKVSVSRFAEAIPVSGRIAQDVEEVNYIMASGSGIVKECYTGLGRSVEKDQTLCRVTLHSNGEVVDVNASTAGTVISAFVQDGDRIDGATALYAIADLSRLWANFDVYEQDIASVQLGQEMRIYPLSYPDKVFKGEVVFISPRVDESTYTVKIRARVENNDGSLKLGMSVRGELLKVIDREVITVPSEAIQTVENEEVVFKKTAHGFAPQEIKVISRAAGTAAITEGLTEGDEIAVKGAFILKSKMMEAEMGHDHAH